MSRSIWTCRPTRRDFLHVGAAAALGAGLPDLLRARATASDRTTAPARGAILIWLAGGPSTIDMWDLKPDARTGIRGEFSPIETSLPGVSIGEHLPETAKCMDRCVLIRSVAHALAEHGPGTELVLTGSVPTPALDYPALGSMASRFLPPRGGVPAYVSLGEQSPGSSGFLGAQANPLLVTPADMAPQGARRVPVELPEGFTVEDLTRREALLARLDRQFARQDRASLTQALSTFEQQALDILRSNKTRQALLLASEPNATREKYGNAWAGRGLLAARRLIEAGVGFVTVSIGGWDTHSNNFAQLRTQLLPQLDRALAALVGDLDQRGLLDETLVYCAGEFGRTPTINGQSGRDHWSRAMSVLLAGGPLPRGSVHGATDAHGMEPLEGRCSPADVNATLLSAMGVAPSATVTTPSGRPIAVMGEGTALAL